MASGWAAMIPVLARITVRGVFSSWEASATNCRCWVQALSTGFRDSRARNRLMAKNTARAAPPMSRELTISRPREARSQLRSEKAMRTRPSESCSCWNRRPRFCKVPDGAWASWISWTAWARVSSVTLTWLPSSRVRVPSASMVTQNTGMAQRHSRAPPWSGR